MGIDCVEGKITINFYRTVISSVIARTQGLFLFFGEY
jgi:hypothetical protein